MQAGTYGEVCYVSGSSKGLKSFHAKMRTTPNFTSGVVSFLLLVTDVTLYCVEVVLVFFYIYPIVPYAPAFFTQLPITSDCCRGYAPETSVTFILRGTGIVLVFFYIYLIVPYAPAFFT